MSLTPHLANVRRGLARNSPAFFGFCFDEARKHCPFIERSDVEHLLYASPYRLDELTQWSDSGDASEALFFVALQHVERFREERMRLSRTDQLLICDNVIITEPTGLSPVALRQLLGWPHWMLKCLYSSKGIMFGKFWKGEQLTTARGVDMVPPSETFISIRTAVLDRDLDFIKKAPIIAGMLSEANDDGMSPLPDTTGITTLMSLTLKSRHEKYLSLRAWSERILAERKLN